MRGKQQIARQQSPQGYKTLSHQLSRNIFNATHINYPTVLPIVIVVYSAAERVIIRYDQHVELRLLPYCHLALFPSGEGLAFAAG